MKCARERSRDGTKELMAEGLGVKAVSETRDARAIDLAASGRTEKRLIVFQ
jgi:uncharacterized membrane protein